jgi:hypothetical protein
MPGLQEWGVPRSWSGYSGLEGFYFACLAFGCGLGWFGTSLARIPADSPEFSNLCEFWTLFTQGTSAFMALILIPAIKPSLLF